MNYIVDPVNVVFYGRPSSDVQGKAGDAAAETLAHIHDSNHTGGSSQHAHVDASPHGGPACVTVVQYEVQVGRPPVELSDRFHVRYFQSTFKDTHTYGWYTMSDAHNEWLHFPCLNHPDAGFIWHHTYHGDQYSSGFETAEALVWQEFAEHGHSYVVKDLGNYYWMDVEHGRTALNTGLAHYIYIG